MSDVVTGEAVALELRLARLPSRVLAFAIDALVQLGSLLLLISAIGRVFVDTGVALRAALTLVVTVLVFVGYPVILETLWRGRTLGKAALGLRVVRDDGGPVRFRQCLARGLLLFFVDVWTTFGFAGLLAQVLSARGKRIGDVLAGTVVIRERVPGAATVAPPMPPSLAAWAASADLSGLSDDLALAARQFTGRAGQLAPAAREEIGQRLVAAVSSVVSPPPPLGTPGWAYLAAVLAERRRREEVRLRNQASRRPAGGTREGGDPAGTAPAPGWAAPVPPAAPSGDRFAPPA